MSKIANTLTILKKERSSLLGVLPFSVELFLLQALKERSLIAYIRVLDAFLTELRQSSFVWAKATDLQRDIFVSEHIVEAFENNESPQNMRTLLACITKLSPQQRFPVSHAVMIVWSRLVPPVQAPACPSELAQALSVLALQVGQIELSTVILLCFEGCLRISEPLNLLVSDVILDKKRETVILILGVTKRGLEQKVSITNPRVFFWMAKFLKYRGSKKGPVFSIGYNRVYYWLPKLCKVLGLSELRLTSHSFRRGKASELFRDGTPIDDICVFGRWASVSSAREYLRKGEVALTRLRVESDARVWTQVDFLCRLSFAFCWKAVADKRECEN